MHVLLRKGAGMRDIWKMAPGLRAAKETLMRIHSCSCSFELEGGKVGMGWEVVRDRMFVGEPRWENVQAREVVAMIMLILGVLIL